MSLKSKHNREPGEVVRLPQGTCSMIGRMQRRLRERAGGGRFSQGEAVRTAIEIWLANDQAMRHGERQS